MNRNLIFYTVVIAVFGSLIWLVFNQGAKLSVIQSYPTTTGDINEAASVENAHITTTAPAGAVAAFLQSLFANLGHPLSLLLIQIVVIVLLSRLLASLVSKIGQPMVIGEIIAGILLGPSILGYFLPGVSQFIFQAASVPNLNFLSQLGLILFMFIIGLELDIQLLKNKAHTAVVVSHASIIIPFTMGVSLAYFLYERFALPHISFLAFGLFMGIAMSITAFPVLARILTDHKLLRTPVGSVTIACAAVDDVTAWCILAGVVLLTRASAVEVPLWITIFGSMGYVCLNIFVVRRILTRLEVGYERGGALTHDRLGVILLFALASAWVTEWLGIHALFGAFLAGTVMPKGHRFVQALNEKIEGMTVVLLLPLFFAFTGLRTSFGLVSSAEMWFYCFLIIAVAILGKFGGSTIAARMSGVPWREASSIGILMNTRGLIELVVLNIGIDMGVLSSALFTMMVLMALVTTFMTSPLLEWVYLAPLRRHERVRADRVQSKSVA